MKKIFLYCTVFILYTSAIHKTVAQIIDNGVITNGALTPIDFANSDPRVLSIATATLPTLDTGVIFIEFRIKGGDGGIATWDGLFTDLSGFGGEGGAVIFTLPITPQNAGQQITIYQGKRGETYTHPIVASGGGGGSTAIVDHNGNVLAIAGGGGGACASEIFQSNGWYGGTQRDGISSCGLNGYAGAAFEPNGTTSFVSLSSIVGETRPLAIGGGGGGGFGGVSLDVGTQIHRAEISGKSAEFGGAGGIRPVEAFFRDVGGCDPSNPFSVGCDNFDTVDVSAGGAGYSGGGAGGAFLNNSSDNTVMCNAQVVSTYGGGGGGGGYLGGGGGDRGRGAGGGSSYASNLVINVSFAEDITVGTSDNGIALYRAFYDTENPVAVCQEATVTLGYGQYISDDGGLILGVGTNGEATLDPLLLEGGSTDNSFIETRTASKTLFTCDDLGIQNVTFTVTDGNNNTDSCIAQVTVVDDFPPTITAATSAIINATDFGIVDLGLNTEMMVTPPTNLTFTDNCAVASVVQATPFTVTCADLGTTINKIVTATDTYGNIKNLVLQYQIISTAAPTGVIYVNANQPDDSGDGSSWATAKKYVNSALALTDNVCNNYREIWVAAGTYYPDEGTGQTNNDRNSSFLLREVSIYGGFNGTETLLNERDTSTNITILSGDLQQNDALPNNLEDNAYRVILANNLESATILDGFTITGGNANGTFFDGIGGAILNFESSLTIRNTILKGNFGIFGGALGNYGASEVTLINTIISGNSAFFGGGINNQSGAETQLINCTITGNAANTSGGAIWSGAASSSLVQNSIIWGNQENGLTTSSGASVVDADIPTVYTTSLVANIVADGIISNENPLFLEPIDFSNTALPTSVGDFHTGNVAIFDTGTAGINTVALDLEGNTRVQSGNIDLGPYEFSKLILNNIFPSTNTTNFQSTSNITLVFNENVPPNLLNNSTIKISSSYTGIVNGTFIGAGSSNLLFEPTVDFLSGDIITVQVTNKLVSNPKTHTLRTRVSSLGFPATDTDPLIPLTGFDSPKETFIADMNGDGDLDIFAYSDTDTKLYYYDNDGSANFTRTTILETNVGVNFIKAAVEDVDNDGDIDFTVTTQLLGVDSLLLFLNDGNTVPNFTIEGIESILNILDIVTGDLNNDGIPEVITSESDGTISTYTFQPDLLILDNFEPVTIYDGLVVKDMELADVDNDGNMDILVSFLISGTIAWLRNDGQNPASFSPIPITPITNSAEIIKASDLNGDGFVDIVVGASINNYVDLYLNDGTSTPSFTVQNITTTINSPRDIDIADVNSDGELDILVASFGDDSVVYYKNDGAATPSFTRTVVSSSVDGANSVITGDLDGDGDIDIVSTALLTNDVYWHKTKGINLLVSTSPSANEINVALDADIQFNFQNIPATNLLNTDNFVVSGSKTGRLQGIFSGENSTNIRFNPTSNFQPGELISITVTDEIVTNPTVFTFTADVTEAGTPATTTSPQNILSTTETDPRAVVSVDMDNDGDLDVVTTAIGSEAVVWFENDGNVPPSFTRRSVNNASVGGVYLAVADINGDGFMDVISGTETGSLLWYQNDQASPPGFIKKSIAVDSASSINTIDTGDIDNDGFTDIIFGTVNVNTIRYLKNDGNVNPTFSNILLVSNAINTSELELNDLNNDGFLDILSVHSDTNEALAYMNLLGAGGLFSDGKIITNTANGPNTMTSADFDGDGDLDVVVVSLFDNTLAWYEHTGDISSINPVFVAHIISTTENGTFDISNADIDGDGDIDILGASALGDEIFWYENDGTSTPSFTKKTVSTAVDYATSITAGDMDGDGDLDLVSSSRFDGKIAWYETTNPVLGTIDYTIDDGLLFYPNPAKKQITIVTNDTLILKKINMYDVSGRLIKTKIINNTTTPLVMDISNFTSGTYFIQIISQKGTTIKKLIKE